MRRPTILGSRTGLASLAAAIPGHQYGQRIREILIMLIISASSCASLRNQKLSGIGALGSGKAAAWPTGYTVANTLRDDADGGEDILFRMRGRSFEIYSDPIELRYGEVHFRYQRMKPLPQRVVEQFRGKHLVVTGYEINVIRVDEHGHETLVPAYDAYNHHYWFHIYGSNFRGCKNKDNKTDPFQDPEQDELCSGFLDSQWFSEGNGNEHRLSYHGYPMNHGQIVYSPDRIHGFFHLINTRGGGGRGGPGSFILPNASLAKPGARYCGLIECPCSDRREIDVEAGTIDGKRIVFKCPDGDDLAAQNNTSCQISTYRGGLRCCEDGVVLLDKSQQQPGRFDTFFFKLRIWYEQATPSTKNLFRVYWPQANGEYDIPQCDPKTQCIHVIKSEMTVNDLCMGRKGLPGSKGCGPKYDPESGFKLMYAGGHLHVGGISIELMNADTGQLLCTNTAVYGASDDPMDEEGYIVSIPPCLWSDDDPRLPKPPHLLGSTRLVFIAKYHNDPGHSGAMSFWQMRAAYA